MQNFCYFQDSWTIFYRLPLQELIEGVLSNSNGLQRKHQSLQGQFYALSFYRSQNVLWRSKFFEPAQKFDAFSASSKTFVLAQKPTLLNANHLFVLWKMFVTATTCE